MATIDADGFMQITDRSKDVIKSGGEWISSIDLENIAMAHPAVAMAAVIAAPSQVGRAPTARRRQKPDASVSREEMLAFYEGRIAKWQIPDDVVFVAERDSAHRHRQDPEAQAARTAAALMLAHRMRGLRRAARSLKW